MNSYITEHYIFRYKEGSLAAKDIIKIAKKQEECFNKICNTLKVSFTEKINYFLYESSEEIGRLYGINEPINGFAVWGENKIFAVYNDKIKCIGPHEDVHLISFAINNPKSNFIVEGLAMFFDEKWWGIDNDIWTSYYYTTNKDISIYKLLNNEEFDNYNCEITYPIAGSFIKYLISSFGIEKFIKLYKISEVPNSNDFKNIYHYTILELESFFWQEISKINYDLQSIKSLIFCENNNLS